MLRAESLQNVDQRVCECLFGEVVHRPEPLVPLGGPVYLAPQDLNRVEMAAICGPVE